MFTTIRTGTGVIDVKMSVHTTDQLSYVGLFTYKPPLRSFSFSFRVNGINRIFIVVKNQTRRLKVFGRNPGRFILILNILTSLFLCPLGHIKTSPGRDSPPNLKP